VEPGNGRLIGAHLEAAGLHKRFKSTVVLQNLDLTVGRGEFVSLLGPSGCGKTTLLRIIAGLLRADGGQLRLAGQELMDVPAHRRKVGVVFQSYALFPHLSVTDNVGFGLRAKGLGRAEIARGVREALNLVRLEDYADRSILALSGGQQQRVAVARAIAVKPALLLLDEPLSALDRKLRETMQIELRRLLRELGVTAIFVTHDQDEALVMSDRIAVMNAGRIEHFGEPATVYARPATPFVLDFVGMACRFHGKVVAASDSTVRVETAAGTLTAPGRLAPGSLALVAVRPEKVELAARDPGFNHASLVVRDLVFLGSKTIVHLAADDPDRALVEVAQLPPAGLRVGTRVDIRWAVADTLLYPAP
jgi:putative spermidine/putrescine transport system ATP-binding protein